jgi:hypothetical protein
LIHPLTAQLNSQPRTNPDSKVDRGKYLLAQSMWIVAFFFGNGIIKGFSTTSEETDA